MFPLAGILYDHVVNNQNRNTGILLCVDVCICVCLSMCVNECRHVCVYSRGQCQVPSSIDHHILVRRDLSNSLRSASATPWLAYTSFRGTPPLPAQQWEYRITVPCQSFMLVLGIEPWSLYFQDNHLNN